MSGEIDLVIDYLLKDIIWILVKGTVKKKKNELIKETIASLILEKIVELKIILSRVSEIKISLTKNKGKGPEKEKKTIVTIKTADIEDIIGTEELANFISGTVSVALKTLNFKPTVVIEKYRGEA